MIYHITTTDAWSAASDAYTAPSLTTEGFIHASRREQICGTADRIFRGRTDLVILCIDESRLEPPVVLEDSYGHGAYPHIYGPVNRDAVAAVVDFPPGEAGRFHLPDSLPA